MKKQDSVTGTPVPENMEETLIKRPVAYYAAGIFLLLYALLFPFYSFVHYLLGGLLTVAVFVVAAKLAPVKHILVPKTVAPVNTGNKDIDEVITNGRKYILDIKAANDAIPDENSTNQINRMEKAAEEIFNYIGQHPTETPQIRKFMNYYLPTTLSLLNKLIELNSQDVKGENILNSINRIEGILSTVADAFDAQLNDLYASAAMDISADVAVMQSMLAQEGIS
ncbi:MAG: 5-bromo-4-chloroindolyl phosphate hydrolysis family protein [Oscillospiraceae bacterium]|nr:5-bromo-4-chloroindolyl phosphate hydrolysis family protein [Oscillospiraceae bacterium]